MRFSFVLSTNIVLALVYALGGQTNFGPVAPASANNKPRSCVDHRKAEMHRLLTVAKDCNAPTEWVKEIESPEQSDFKDVRAECQRRADSLTEQDCDIVPICLALALRFAVENIDRFDGDCTSATEAGLKFVFVPE